MDAQETKASDGTRLSLQRFRFLLPAAVFGLIAIAFAVGLTMKPRELPSALVGKTVPKFDLPPVTGRTLGLSDRHLRGQVSLVNVFASWCTECRVEHPFLMELSRNGKIPLHGLNYKDRQKDASVWLNALGDPYVRTGADTSGRVGIDWGVYGVPETFVVGPDGRIAYKHIGTMNAKIFEERIMPVIRRLEAPGS